MKNISTLQFSLEVADQMHLSHVDPETQLRLTKNYPLLPFPQGIINPEVLLPAVRTSDGTPVDATVFISRRRSDLTTAGASELALFNKMAYDEAGRMPGFRLYIQGDQLDNPEAQMGSATLDFISFVPDCYSFCLWNSHEQALDGSATRPHGEAMKRVREWYSDFAIQKLEVSVKRDQKGEMLIFKDKGIHVFNTVA